MAACQVAALLPVEACPVAAYQVVQMRLEEATCPVGPWQVEAYQASYLVDASCQARACLVVACQACQPWEASYQGQSNQARPCLVDARQVNAHRASPGASQAGSAQARLKALWGGAPRAPQAAKLLPHRVKAGWSPAGWSQTSSPAP